MLGRIVYIFSWVCCAKAALLCQNAFCAPVFGSMSFACAPDGDSVVSFPVSRIPAASGVVESVDAGALTIVSKDALSGGENAFVYDSAANPDHYYLKFTSGALEGAWFDVSANTSQSVSVKIGASDISSVEKGDSFEIIPHWTLNSLFPNGGVLKKNDVPAKGVKCSIVAKYTYYDESGTLVVPKGVNNAYQKFFYYRQYGNDVGWRERRSGNLDCGDQIIEPNSFIILRHFEEGEPATLKISGCVPQCATAVEVVGLSDSNQENYAAMPSCCDISLSSLTASLVDSGLFAASTGAVRPADALLLYDNSAFDKYKAPTETFFYYAGALSPRGWYKVGSGSPSQRKADDYVLKAGSALVILKKSDGTDTFLRIKYKPPYIAK